MHSFEVHSNESACRKSGRLGLEQVLGGLGLMDIRKQEKNLTTVQLIRGSGLL